MEFFLPFFKTLQMKNLSLIVFLLAVTISVYSQAKKFSFSGELEKYPNELFTVMGAGKLSEEEDKLLKDFADAWKAGFLTEEQKKQVIDISNLMLVKNARGNPHFTTLISCLLTITKNEQFTKSYSDWMDGMFRILKTSKTMTAVTGYMNFSINLATDGNVFESGTLQWRFSNPEFTIKADTFGVWLNFSKGNLTCYSRRDSIVIFETSGKVNPIENRWIGKSGRVTWERAGYDVEQVHAVLKNYTIELKKSELSADSVSFTHKQYFPQAILGKLHSEVVPIPTPAEADYPRFDSYNKRYKITKLYEGVDYEGGFSMRGAKVVGSGSDKEDATIRITNKGKELMVAKSKFFVFRPEKVTGLNSQTLLHLDKDSLFHSDVTFVYNVPQKEINLLRGADYSARSMYSNSYHGIDMDFDLLSWKIDQPIIKLTMSRGATIGKGRFVSQNFYNQSQFDALQGMDDVHPLVALRKYSRSIGTDRFYAGGFADYRNKNLSEIRQVLMAMAQEGFIYYNIQTDEVRLKKRLYNFLDSSTGKIDFDVMDFNSSTQAPQENATLNMENYDLIINGIPRIFLSDSQNVVIYPNNERITLKQNRSFQFDGKIDAGLFSFYGSNFFFDYKDFKINLQNVDSVQLKVFTGELDNFGRPLTHDVMSVIQHITGDLVIDKADNKSGRKNYPAYPLFTSREKSYVYYNSSEIQNGAYPRDNFYFELSPFVIDSLDNFKKEGLVFKGKFESAGILPTLENELYLQPDYSLGFNIDKSQDGIPVYDGKGTLYAKVQLSNNGLHADGKLKHLTTTSVSKDYMFYPDSMQTFAESFNMTKQAGATEFPQVASTENDIKWYPKKEEMLITQKKDPFNLLSDSVTLAGSLKLKPTGLSGKGTMDLKTAVMASNEFRYKSQSFDSDTASFNLRSLQKPGFTVLTKNVNAHIDFGAQKGAFTSNEDYTLVEFPENKYISYLDHFNWNMEDKTLEMSAQKARKNTTNSLASQFPYKFNEEPEGPRYISVNRSQDSLSFVSSLAIYNYEKNIINASNVKLIRSADAIIYTSDGKVTVEEGGIMKTIYKATVVTNYQTKYHTFKMAAVNIYGRKKYAGEGEYDYVDEIDRTQILKFKEIKVNDSLQTEATASVTEADSFTLSPYFDFQGKVKLNANERLLNFDGSAHVRVDCGKVQPHWLLFESVIDPKKVMIPISSDPLNINRNKIASGIMIASDSIHIYPAFLTKKRNYADVPVATADGYLIYDKDSSTYNIAANEKLADHNSPGNFLSINRDDCSEYGEGRLNLGIDLGQLKLTAVGNVTHQIIPNHTDLDFMLGLDFLIDPVALNLFANKVDSFPGLAGINFSSKAYFRGMNEILGEKGSKDYHDELKLFGFVKVYPPELIHTISFSHMKLTWDDETNSYYYVGKVGIASIGNKQINKVVDAYVEIFKKRTGDIMDVYLKLDDNNWFYFGYTRGVMQTLSSHEGFVSLIKKLPNKVRQMDVHSGQTPYIYMVASDAKWGNFKKQYQQRIRKLSMPDESLPDIPEVTAPAKKETTAPPQNSKPVKTPPSKTEVEKKPENTKAKDEKTPDTKQPANDQPEKKQEEVKKPEVEKEQPKKEEQKEEEKKEEEEVKEIM